MGVEIQDRQVNVDVPQRPDRPDGDGVLAAQQSDQLPGSRERADHALHPVHHRLRPADVGLDLGGSVDPHLGDIAVQLQVVVLELSGGGDDGLGAVTRAALVRGGAVVGDRDQDDPGAVEAAGRLRGVEEGVPVAGRGVRDTLGPVSHPRGRRPSRGLRARVPSLREPPSGSSTLCPAPSSRP